MSDWQDYLDGRQQEHLEEMLEFLRIPSISSLSEHAGDVRRAAEWVAARLKRAGIEGVRLLESGRHPLVYGEWLHAPGKPTVLIYGHFDVQPVDPLHLWSHPPFDPQVEGDRVYARGASDDKGNMLVPILAAEALLATRKALPLNVKFLFEGEEEIGSPSLPAFLDANREILSCDLIVSADGSQYSEDQPALWLGLRGLTSLQLDVRGAAHDLHSGMYGGAVQNPLHALVQVLDSMHDGEGRVTVAGFYDDVKSLDDADRARFEAVPFDEAAEREKIGLPAFFGEPGYTVLERRWARPTLELNGVWGGFQGEGSKTVIPAEAHAKITCRLVADQEPKDVLSKIQAHVAAHTPPGVRVEVKVIEVGVRAYLMPAEHPGNQAARDVHLELYGKEPIYVRSGGSIPFCSLMLQKLDAFTLNFAFGMGDERAHAPDEFYRLGSFRKGLRGYGLLLERLAEATLG